MTNRSPADGTFAKSRYHHGDLRETLLAASFELISKQGADNFSLADACRLAGVSTAAPYKHFRDRDEVLEIIVARAFDVMSGQSMAAVEAVGVGTIEGIIAMGQAYVRFAVEEQNLFRLMFGQHPILKQADTVVNDGKECFGGVIRHVAIYSEQNGLDGDPMDIALRLWTFVHGVASLLIDGDYASVAPGLDVDRFIADAAPLLLRDG